MNKTLKVIPQSKFAKYFNGKRHTPMLMNVHIELQGGRLILTYRMKKIYFVLFCVFLFPFVFVLSLLRGEIKLRTIKEVLAPIYLHYSLKANHVSKDELNMECEKTRKFLTDVLGEYPELLI